ncbi:MAG: hypothetical protein KME23_20705 [Goleter apudmare HA4340-LM2]|jgi:hypothetical protein|nr:hypothetical protein [Goleter apudmare HA4340-LM2]
MTVGLMKNPHILNKVLGGAIAILVTLLLWLAYQFIHLAGNFVKVDYPSPIVVQVRNMSELTTAMFQMEAVVPVSEKGGP